MLLGAKYGRRLHFWDLHKRKHLQTIDFGDKYQLVFELRPAHDPTKAYGFVNCVISLENLSSSIWTWYHDGDKWAVKKMIEIPAEPADPDLLPPVLKGFKAVPPLVTDIDLSMDDKFLYVACWGTGDLQQYDVSDPFKPKLTGKVRIGGIVSRATHPGAKNGALSGGPQMVEISRDGKRVYFTNSLYGAIDPQFYPDGIDGWMVKLDAKPDGRHRLRREVLRGVAGAAPAAPGAARGRRLLVGFLLLSVRRAGARAAHRPEAPRALAADGQARMTDTWPWLALAGLGAFHGLNPAMGWLFAVALGLHRQSREVVFVSLLPIAAGHALSIAVCGRPAGCRRHLRAGRSGADRLAACCCSAGRPTTGASAIATACASACRRGSWASASGRS